MMKIKKVILLQVVNTTIDMICNIINLRNRIDRKESAIREFGLQGAEIQFWDGIVWNPTYTGVAKAHKQIVIDARNRKLPKVLIGEDDIKFLGKGALDYFLQNEPLDYDIYFAGIFAGEIDVNNVCKAPQGLTLYMIHERFYDYFIGLPEDYHIDVYLNGLGKYVVCDKFCVTQYNGRSDNNGYLCDYTNSLAGRPLFS